MGEQKQQQRGNTSVAPPTPWSSIMAWRTLMAMVMAALLATSSCLAQDALPDLPDVPEMPAIGTTVNSRLDRRRLLHGGVPTGGMPAIGTTSESLYSMGRRSLQQYPGINMPGPFLAEDGRTSPWTRGSRTWSTCSIT